MNRFMTLWDGLTSANASGMPAQIVVLGATNRIHDIDEAILRRMPKKFPVPLPGEQQRRKILDLVLQGTKTDPDNFDLDYLAKLTAGMSGSDIKETCRDAAMAPVREFMRDHRPGSRSKAAIDPSQFRGIRSDDFFGSHGGQLPRSTASHSKSTKSKGLKGKGKKKNQGSDGDEYEDVDELVVEEQD